MDILLTQKIRNEIRRVDLIQKNIQQQYAGYIVNKFRFCILHNA